MKVPLSWLREYVEVNLAVPELAERLTLAGLEVSGVRMIGLPVPQGLHVKGAEVGPVWAKDKLVIGKVLGVERHPNADRLTLATVDYGAGEPKTVVTGAPNIKVGDQGQKVIIALSGSVLYDGHAQPKTLKELKPGKIRGILSDAMVCSAFELGISDEHEGIILLEDEAPVGMPLVDFMGDIVLELEITPNLARCLSMIGVAREVAALTGQTIRLPKLSAAFTGEPIAGQVEVAIEDPALSARYAALLIKNIKIGSAPGWMQRRLTYAGMRPISNIVDVTNYVMLEWGQPLHAFDHDILVQRAGGRSPTITVRSARKGEVLQTLDGQKRELSPEHLVIADVGGPIALAGVMGGAETEVSGTTRNVLLESANFDFRSIRRTMKAMNLPSEASVRFSRGIHPELVAPAGDRAADLMHQFASGTVASGRVDAYPAPLPAQIIDLNVDQVERVLGFPLAGAEAERILTALEYHVEKPGPNALRITAPTHRVDIQVGMADLIEDLARINGYDRMPATLLADQLPGQHTNTPFVREERVRDLLTGLGLQEIITYALTDPAKEAPLRVDEAEYVRLLNPISSERVVMRHTLLAGALEVAAANSRHTNDVRLFEIGSVYLRKPGEKLPEEPTRLAMVLTGQRQAEFWVEGATSKPASLDFFDLKGIVEALVADLHLPDVVYRQAKCPYLHPGQAAELVVQGDAVGSFGLLHPRTAEAYDLAGRAVLVGSFELEALLARIPARYTYSPVPRFPAALRDIAVIVPDSISAERLVAEIRTAGGDLLREIRLFDVYRGDSIPAGTKSLAYALTYLADDRTLTDKEVDKAHKKIADRLKHVLKAQIRGE